MHVCMCGVSLTHLMLGEQEQTYGRWLHFLATADTEAVESFVAFCKSVKVTTKKENSPATCLLCSRMVLIDLSSLRIGR